jgi:hypothetical protein
MTDRLTETLEDFQQCRLQEDVYYLAAEAAGVTADNLNLADVKSPTKGMPATGKPCVFIFESTTFGEWFLEAHPEFKGEIVDWADGDAFIDLLKETDIEYISLWMMHKENQWTEYTEYLEDFE